jgi:hypothetical protein
LFNVADVVAVTVSSLGLPVRTPVDTRRFLVSLHGASLDSAVPAPSMPSRAGSLSNSAKTASIGSPAARRASTDLSNGRLQRSASKQWSIAAVTDRCGNRPERRNTLPLDRSSPPALARGDCEDSRAGGRRGEEESRWFAGGANPSGARSPSQRDTENPQGGVGKEDAQEQGTEAGDDVLFNKMTSPERR